MSTQEKFLKAIKKLRELEIAREKKINFSQTIDLIVNLKEFDVKRNSFNIFITLPHKIKEKKIAGFFEKDSKLVHTIKKDNFPMFREKKDLKSLIKEYDFFIANAKLMPAVATTFGRTLGPSGKMPSPQLGILISEDEKLIKETVEKISSTVRVIAKEPSIKVGVAKDSLSDEKIAENALTAYARIFESLPKGIDNIRNIKIKFTMSKPVLVE